MRKLVEYRQQKALHHQLMKAADCSDLRKNLKGFGFLDRVTLINGRSFNPPAARRARFGSSMDFTF
jgi:hypothetical protein